MIRIAVAVGFGPSWVQNEGKNPHEAAEDYYEYLQTCTYYRLPWKIVKVFNDKGLDVDTRMTEKAIKEKSILGKVRWFVPLASRLSILFHTYGTPHLLTEGTRHLNIFILQTICENYKPRRFHFRAGSIL